MIRLNYQDSRWLATGSLTGQASTGFCELLLLAGACDEALILDVSGVERIDMHGVQTLAAFVNSGSGNRIEKPSAAVRNYLARVGALSLISDEWLEETG